MPRSTHRYVSVRPSQAALRQKIRDLARSRIRYGYRRIHVLLKREGFHYQQEARLSPVLRGRPADQGPSSQTACHGREPAGAARQTAGAERGLEHGLRQ